MSQYKRKYDGPPISDLRKGDVIPRPTPERKPPHKRLRIYTLDVRWVWTLTDRITKRYTSKASRDAARKLLERDIKDKRHLYYWSSQHEKRIIEGPIFSESMEDLG